MLSVGDNPRGWKQTVAFMHRSAGNPSYARDGRIGGAGIKLIECLGGKIIDCAFIIGLPDRGGRRRREAMGHEVHALCAFAGL